MSDTVISVEDLSKQYRLGMVGAGTLREDFIGWWYKLRGKEDPYLKIGETNDRSTVGNSDYVWALKEVNFEVKQGEVLGIIGKNGAGKSTLLKLLSRVTSPTTGTIKAKGRIASLLEVGTGFHPELTGRENIFLNGAIMGMNRAEIKSKLDEIVEFAGVQRYIDTPVKRYSSGMYVRLAFAVAAHLEPEILIVDEVLAVGDAEFQKKAIGKMEDVSGKSGRTVLFVSHNMKAVKSLCPRAILMENGRAIMDGASEEVVSAYLGSNKTSAVLNYQNPDGKFQNGVRIIGGRIVNELPITTANVVKVAFELEFTDSFEFHFNIHIKSADQIHLFQSSCKSFIPEIGRNYTVEYDIPSNLLNERYHSISISMVKDRSSTFYSEDGLLSFTVELNDEENNLQWFGTTPGLLKPRINNRVI